MRRSRVGMVDTGWYCQEGTNRAKSQHFPRHEAFPTPSVACKTSWHRLQTPDGGIHGRTHVLLIMHRVNQAGSLTVGALLEPLPPRERRLASAITPPEYAPWDTPAYPAPAGLTDRKPPARPGMPAAARSHSTSGGPSHPAPKAMSPSSTTRRVSRAKLPVASSPRPPCPSPRPTHLCSGCTMVIRGAGSIDISQGASSGRIAQEVSKEDLWLSSSHEPGWSGRGRHTRPPRCACRAPVGEERLTYTWEVGCTC